MTIEIEMGNFAHLIRRDALLESVERIVANSKTYDSESCAYDMETLRVLLLGKETEV